MKQILYGYTRDMYGICMGYVRDMYGTSMGDQWIK